MKAKSPVSRHVLRRSLAVLLAYVILAQATLVGLAGAVHAAEHAAGRVVPIILCSGADLAPDQDSDHRDADCPCGAMCPLVQASGPPASDRLVLIGRDATAQDIPLPVVHAAPAVRSWARKSFPPRAPPGSTKI
jgi:hypothetical protein